MNEGLPTVPWPIVRKLLDVATILGADTVSLTERGQNAADYVAEFGDPVFLETINRELAITPKAYATDESCTLGICNGFRGLLLTRPVRRIDWSGKRSMGRDRPLSDFAGYLCRNKCLEELIMRECALEVPGASALFSSLAVNRSLLRLDLMRNPGIGSEDALKVLGSSLCSNKALQELVLWACDISASGVAVLCSGLAENTSLLKLNLRENKGLGAPEAVSAIGSLLGKNDTLQELDLWECGIKADSVCWLYEGLGRNKGLKMLGLVGNRGLGQHAVIEALTNCLQMNSTLESLTMSGCSVKPGSIDDPRVVL
jgi:Ran GTPase-activating protein (RanGAP) involved in mRNA processing and transport